MSAPARRGWCPGVLRPMQTGDGLLARVRPLGGILSLAQAAAIAECASACGNGHLDLTSRANVQIRGVRDATLPDLVERLRHAGLLGRDGEDVMLDIVSSPLAGVDPSEWIDVRPVVAALAVRAAHDPALHALPAKFGFVVDGGGRPGLAEVAADVRFVAVRSDVFEVQAADMPLGRCMLEAVPDVAVALASRFLELRGDDHRMRPLIERVGAEAFTRAAGRGPLLALRGRRGPDEVGSDEGGSTARLFSPPTGGRGCHDRPHPTFADAKAVFSRGAEGGVRLLGFHKTHLGVAFPFGRLEAADLATLSRLAASHGARDIRLTPWRSLFVAGLARSSVLDPARFIIDQSDLRLAVAACPGALACPSGTTATRIDATALAPLIHQHDGIALHVSGCSKGCAHAGPAPITLVGNAGRYDLVRNGTAQAKPITTGLTAQAAAAMLAPTRVGGAAA